MLRARLVVLAPLFAACAGSGGGTSTEPPKADVAATVPDRDASVEASVDASAPDAPVEVQGCTVKRVADPDTCAEPCDARLTLPAEGGTYCTLQCAKDEDCGGTLACPSTVGACMPRCTSDTSCKAAGFARCDATTGACDTI